MEQDKVFNRKLFQRKSAARDKLRSMGGIMASSEPLIKEAMRTVSNAPQPQIDLQGIMAAQKRRGPMQPQPLPQIVPGQSGMPSMAQMQQPQPQMAQAPQPQMQQPAPQPQAGANPMQQQPQQPMRMGNGGRPIDQMMGAVPQEYMGAAMGNIPAVNVGSQAGSVRRPQPAASNEIDLETLTPDRAIQLSSAAMSGKFPVNLSPFTEENAGSQEAANLLNSRVQHIGTTMRNQNLTAEQKSREIIAALGGDASAEDVKSELNKVAEKTYGKKVDREAKIDSINQAITGFAIAAGTSPRATKNIANGMLVGLGEMKSSEEKRVAAEEARKLAAMRGSGSGSGDKVLAETRRDIIRNITTNPTNFGINAYDMSPEEFGRTVNSVADAILSGTRTATGTDPAAPGVMQEMENPETGQIIVFRDGAWVDKETGNPVQ